MSDGKTAAVAADDTAHSARRAALIAAGRAVMRRYALQKYLDNKEKYETHGKWTERAR